MSWYELWTTARGWFPATPFSSDEPQRRTSERRWRYHLQDFYQGFASVFCLSVFQLFCKFKYYFRRHRARKGWKECPCQVRGQWGQWRNKGKYLQKIKQKSFTSFTFQLPKVIEGKSLLLEDNTHRHFPGLLPMLLVHIKLNFLALSPFFTGLPGSLPPDRWSNGSFSSAEQGGFFPTWSRG